MPLALVKRADSLQVRGREQQALSFESPTAEVLAQQHPASERATLYVLASLIVAMTAFISVVKVDRIVTASGRLVPITGGLTVQPLEKQIIKRVLVSVGDVVKKGQVLASCDPTFAQADRVRLEQEVASLDAQARRMSAEDTNHSFVALAGKPYDALQDQIYHQRQSEFRSGTSDFDQRISGAVAQLDGLRQNITDYRRRLKIGAELEGMDTKLAKDGFVSQLQLLGVQDQQVELGRRLSEAENSLVSTSHQLESLREQRTVFINKWRDENLNALVSARNTLEAAQQELAKADKVSELVDLVAPEDAIVTRIPTLATGAVASGGQTLFSLVPLNAPLEAKVQIDAQDIGFIKVGDPVNVKFEAFKFLEHGVGRGVVKSISQDSFTDVTTLDAVSAGADSALSRSAFYDARIGITEMQLHDVPTNFRLIPGMTLYADIVVGRRTILWYLLGGALRSGAEAMREP